MDTTPLIIATHPYLRQCVQEIARQFHRRKAYDAAYAVLAEQLSFFIMSAHQNTPDKAADATKSVLDSATLLRQRLGPLDRQQIAAWQQMSPARRLEMAFQAYQFALDAVRLCERRDYPHLSEEELNWRIVRRMQGRRAAERGAIE